MTVTRSSTKQACLWLDRPRSVGGAVRIYDVSDRFLAALLTSHEVVSTADVWRDGVLLLAGLAITGGSVTVDESSKVRRTLALSSSDISLEPDALSDLLTPFGTELRVFSGIRFIEGDVETVPVGVFRVQTVDRRGYLSGLDITGDDRARAIADARLLKPRTFTSATTVISAITTLVTEVLTGVEVFDLTFSPARCPALTIERDRWDAVEGLARGIAAEAFFDPAGRLIIRPVPQHTASTVPEWTVAAGATDAALLDVATGLSGDHTYNAVVATSSAQDVVGVTGIAYQSTGPLRWRAGYQRPRFYASPVLRTVSQCQSAAKAILARSVLFARSVSPLSLPNPALEGGDPLDVVLPSDVSEIRTASKFTVPLYLDSMPIETRVGIDAVLATDVGELA